MIRRLAAPSALTVGLLVFGACEPSSITEARQQLESSGPDTFALTLPLLVDTVTLADAFTDSGSDTASTATGAFGLRVDQQSVSIGIADALSFDSVSFEDFTLGYDGLLETSEVSESFTVSAASVPPLAPPPGMGTAPAPAPPFGSDTIRFTTGTGAAVIAAQIASGVVVRTIDNQTNCTLETGVSLRDSSGGVIASMPDTMIAGSTLVTDSIDLAGVTVQGWVEPDPTVGVSSCSGVPTGSLTVGFTFRPLTMASVTVTGVDETFTGGYAPFDDRFDPLDTIGVEDGGLSLEVTSSVPLQLTVDLVVDGLLEGGVPMARTIVIPAAAPGNTIEQAVDLDLAGTVLVPGDAFVNVVARAVADTATVTAATIGQAATVNGSGSLDIAELIGRLDPVELPELAQPVEVEEIIDPGSIDFDDLEDVVRGVTIRDAQISFLLDNGLNVPFSLDTFRIGVARTDGFGSALRDGLGEVIWETDSVGAPIMVGLAAPGSDVLPVPASGTVAETRQAASLVDRIVDLLLDDEPAALVTTGTVVVGDGSPASVSAGDSVTMAVDLVVGFDVVLPDTGLVFDVSEAVETADFEEDDIAEIRERLIDAEILGIVESGFPVELTLEVAAVAGFRPESVDVFGEPDRVDVGTIVVPAAAVDPASGLAVTPVIDTVSASLTGNDATVFLGDSATVAMRVRVRGDATAGGRARLRSTDRISVRLVGMLRALLGGGS